MLPPNCIIKLPRQASNILLQQTDLVLNFLSMATETPLCSRCARIDFHLALFSASIRPHNLGSWESILQKDWCSFCCLVANSLSPCLDNQVPTPKDEIVLHNQLSWQLGIEQSAYDRLRSYAYSNMFDLRSMAKLCGNDAYRFVVSVKSEPRICGQIQYIAGEKTGRSGHFFGRLIPPERLDVGLINSWLRRCSHWHGDNCEEDGIAGDRLPDNLRLIDVEARQIIRAKDISDLRYATLSYVWGTLEMKKAGMEPAELRRADIVLTEDGNEATPLPMRIPQTIDDAILLSKRLGFRYIWVDALCIVQDDSQADKQAHLERMDAVYNCSTLTIAAASGEHGHVGLLGISVPRQNPQFVRIIHGRQLASMSRSFSQLENSKSLVWNSRGWTFQEKILAKRLLLFTDSQVYYRCSESIWTEEVRMETQRLSSSIEARPQKYRWGPDRPHLSYDIKTEFIKFIFPYLNVDDPWGYLGLFPDYIAAVREYSQRSLTSQDDILRAIGGVFSTMEKSMGKFQHGLPEAHFLQSLLWYPEPGSIHMQGSQALPSWSWAGWESNKGIGYGVLDVRVLRSILIALRKLGVKLGKAAMRILDSLLNSLESSSSENSSSSPAQSSTSTPATPSYSQPTASAPNTSSSAAPPGSSFNWSDFKPFGDRE